MLFNLIYDSRSLKHYKHFCMLFRKRSYINQSVTHRNVYSVTILFIVYMSKKTMRLLYNLISGEEPVFIAPGGDHEAGLACGADRRQR